jgi:hypothetical protein
MMALYGYAAVMKMMGGQIDTPDTGITFKTKLPSAEKKF